MPSQPVTKSDLAAFGDGLRETLRGNTRDVVAQVTKGQVAQDQRLDRIESKVEGIAEDVAKIKLAVVDLLATDRHIHNLVRELKANNVPVDEGRVFAE